MVKVQLSSKGISTEMLYVFSVFEIALKVAVSCASLVAHAPMNSRRLLLAQPCGYLLREDGSAFKGNGRRLSGECQAINLRQRQIQGQTEKRNDAVH